MSAKAIALLLALAILNVSKTQANTNLTLVAEEHELFVATSPSAAKLSVIVKTAFDRMGESLKLDVMRPAFIKGAISSGRVGGEFAATDLTPKRPNLLYSDSYFRFELVAASRDTSANRILSINDLDGQRVAVINLFANTPPLREFKRISWSRNPITFDALKQLAEKRTPYLLASKHYINELNTLLYDNHRQLLNVSPQVLISTGVSIGVNKDINNAASIIDRFNSEIRSMKQDGTFNKLLSVQWILADINDDGFAEWITAADHETLTQNDAPHYPYFLHLDESAISPSMPIYIDGKKTSLAHGVAGLPSPFMRGSAAAKLDTGHYQGLLKDW